VGDHDYDSSDHGLFIAGIVHLIAPKVKIYVIQVIDDNGVGTFQNYAAGFSTVKQLHQNENPNAIPIVNCSFAFSIPIDGHEKSRLDKNLQDFEDVHEGFKPQIDAFRMALDDILTTGAKVFAASGNDSAGDGVDLDTHLSSRYPAQFEDVIGVGSIKWDALNVNNRVIASYSNIADKPNCEGFYAYGGDFEDGAPLKPNQSDYVDGGKGVVSIFTGNLAIEIGEHDDSHHGDEHAEAQAAASAFLNENGLAEWKGTSFATPIIAAYYARLISESGRTRDAAINKIDQNCDKIAGGLRKFKFGKQRHP
jgi:subtilase family serine protease